MRKWGIKLHIIVDVVGRNILNRNRGRPLFFGGEARVYPRCRLNVSCFEGATTRGVKFVIRVVKLGTADCIISRTCDRMNNLPMTSWSQAHFTCAQGLQRIVEGGNRRFNCIADVADAQRCGYGGRKPGERKSNSQDWIA